MDVNRGGNHWGTRLLDVIIAQRKRRDGDELKPSRHNSRGTALLEPCFVSSPW